MVYRLFPGPEASLLAGILLGVETTLPQSVRQAFWDTGTAHIIAISGFNITVVVVSRNRVDPYGFFQRPPPGTLCRIVRFRVNGSRQAVVSRYLFAYTTPALAKPVL